MLSCAAGAPSRGEQAGIGPTAATCQQEGRVSCLVATGPISVGICTHRFSFRTLFSRSPSSNASAQEGLGCALLSGFSETNRPEN